MWLSIGGPILGILIAIITYKILKWLKYKKILFIVFSINICYFTFYIAESDFFKIKVSGILAIVMLGLY